MLALLASPSAHYRWSIVLVIFEGCALTVVDRKASNTLSSMLRQTRRSRPNMWVCKPWPSPQP